MPSSTDWRDSCTYETCGLRYAYFGYRPSKNVNLAFTVLFGIATAGFLAQGIVSKKRWLGFTIAMMSGCALEVIGYTGRVLAYDDLWHEIVCLTIGPAFLAAGIYLCLAAIVVTFGVENSRIKAISYPRIFIPCDILSLILQAAGGGYASIKTHLHEDATIGNNIMIAGLAFQVFTLLGFILLALDFARNTIRRAKQVGTHDAMDPTHAALRKSLRFKGFLVALTLSTLCIFARCVYRVAELSQGWNGHLINVQSYFIGLEGAVIVAAVYLLLMFHPGLAFRETPSGRVHDADARINRIGGSKSSHVTGDSSLEETKV